MNKLFIYIFILLILAGRDSAEAKNRLLPFDSYKMCYEGVSYIVVFDNWNKNATAMQPLYTKDGKIKECSNNDILLVKNE